MTAAAARARRPVLGLVPWPRSVTRLRGSLALGAAGRIVAERPELEVLAGVVADEMTRLTGVRLPTASENGISRPPGASVERLTTSPPSSNTVSSSGGASGGMASPGTAIAGWAAWEGCAIHSASSWSPSPTASATTSVFQPSLSGSRHSAACSARRRA